MIIHHRTKFGCYANCGSADAMLLVIEEQDSTSLPKPTSLWSTCHESTWYALLISPILVTHI